MLPKRVKVHGSWWAIRVVKELKPNGDHAYGFCNYDEQTIFLESGPEWKMRTYLRHEVFHAAIFSTGLWRLMVAAMPDGETREQLEELLNDIAVPAFLDSWVPIMNKSENARANPRTPRHPPTVRKRRRAKGGGRVR